MVSFRKRIRLGDHSYLNLSKSGVSFSSGVPGFRMTIGNRSIDRTYSLPGTGIYSRRRIVSAGRRKTSRRKSYSYKKGASFSMPTLPEFPKTLRDVLVARNVHSKRAGNLGLLSILLLILTYMFSPFAVILLVLIPIGLYQSRKGNNEVDALMKVIDNERSEALYLYERKDCWKRPLVDIAQFVVLNECVNAQEIKDAYNLCDASCDMAIEALTYHRIISEADGEYAVCISMEDFLIKAGLQTETPADDSEETPAWSQQEKDIAQHIVTSQSASTSEIQRRYGLGYRQALGIMSKLESAGIIGPARGSSPREVFVKSLDQLPF